MGIINDFIWHTKQDKFENWCVICLTVNRVTLTYMPFFQDSGERDEIWKFICDLSDNWVTLTYMHFIVNLGETRGKVHACLTVNWVTLTYLHLLMTCWEAKMSSWPCQESRETCYLCDRRYGLHIDQVPQLKPLCTYMVSFYELWHVGRSWVGVEHTASAGPWALS